MLAGGGKSRVGRALPAATHGSMVFDQLTAGGTRPTIWADEIHRETFFALVSEPLNASGLPDLFPRSTGQAQSGMRPQDRRLT